MTLDLRFCNNCFTVTGGPYKELASTSEYSTIAAQADLKMSADAKSDFSVV